MTEMISRTSRPLVALLLVLLISSVNLSSCVKANNNSDVLLLTDEERQFLHDRRDNLVLSYDPSFAPIEFTDEQGAFSGFSSDLFGLIERSLGVTFAVITFDSWGEMLEAAREGKVDIVSQIAHTPQRERYLNFTNSYLQIPNVIVVRKDINRPLQIEDLKGMKVGVADNYAIHEVILENHPSIDLVPTSDEKMGLMQLSVGEIDAMIVYISSASYFIQHFGLSNVKIAGTTPYEFNFAIGSNKSLPLLNSVLQKALDSIPDEEIVRLRKKWYQIQEKKFYQDKRFIAGVILIGALFSLAFFVISAWNRALRTKVNRRTRDLATARNYLSTIINSIQSAIISISADWKISEFNKAARLYCADECPIPKGELFSTAFPLLHQFEKEIRETLDNAVTHKRSILHSLHDQHLYLNIFFIPIHFAKNKSGVLVRIDDVTEVEHKEQQIRQIQKMELVGTLAGGIAHDFNNMLCGILGPTSLLNVLTQGGRPVEMETLQKNLALIENSCHKAGVLVRQLLTLSRNQEYSFSSVDLNTVLENVVAICMGTFDRAVEIELHLFPGPAIVCSDGTQLEQTFLNLCNNGYHAMTVMRDENEKQGGRLSVRINMITADDSLAAQNLCRKGRHYWLVEICDTGVGMSDEVTKRMFDPFFTTKPKDKGTGLGLATVLSFVKKNDGFITTYSKEGQGTAIATYLPVYKPEDQVEQDLPMATIAYPRGSGTILVIDDEEIVRETATAILQKCGYRIIAARDGEEGIEVFLANRDALDLILLDVVMPKKSGLEVYQEIRNHLPDLPVIISSGFMQDSRVQKSLQMGACDFIQKPYTFSELAKKVHSVLHTPRASQKLNSGTERF